MFWTSIFIEPMEVLFAGTQAALNVFVQSTVLIGIGLAAGWILRAKGAAVRSVVYRTTFVVVLLCPVLSWIGLSPRIESMAIPRPSLDVGNYDLAAMEPPRTAEAAFRAEAEAAREPAAAVPSTVEKTPQPEARVLTANGSSRVRSADVWSLLAVAWSAAWLGVTGFLFARLALSSVRSIHARFRARAASSAILAECGSLAERMNAPIPAVLRSPSPGSPCLVGLLKPAILLPASEENQDTVEAEVLSHELAHLARHDCFWYLFARIMTALLWFQPLSWILSRRLMQASEEVCDDHVLDLGFNRNDYARRLAGIAERRQTALVAAVPMASLKSRLGRRVTRILDSSRSLSVRTGRRFVVTTTLAGLVLGGIVSQLGAGKAPSRKEAIEHIESLGGEVNGGCVTIPRKWSGTLADLGFLKAVGDVRKIWFSGTEFEEVRLEDLPELRRIVFNTNFFDEELKQQVVLKRLPIKTIRLANLPKLRELDALNMSETEITRLELDDMPGLVTLEVMGLQIGDGVLQSVSEAPNLTKVTAARPMSTKTTGRTHVTDAGLEGLASLKHLSDLSLDGARVTDAGMETIGRLTSLKTLSLATTDITDAGLAELRNLRDLKSLSLNGTAITDKGLRAVVGANPGLTSIGVAETKVTPEGLEALLELSELTRLAVDPSQLTETSCRVLEKLPLKWLCVSGDCDRAANIAGLPDLPVLYLQGTRSLHIAPESLGGLTKVYARGAGPGAIDALFRHLRYTKQLDRLVISSGWREDGSFDADRPIHVDDELMRHVADLDSLKLLWFDGRSAVGDAGVAHLARLKSIEHILLPRAQVTDRGAAAFAGLENLKRLDLCGSGITNEGLVHFRNLKNLTMLNLNETAVEREVAERILREHLPRTDIQAY